jgi:hypothetical protein
MPPKKKTPKSYKEENNLMEEDQVLVEETPKKPERYLPLPIFVDPTDNNEKDEDDYPNIRKYHLHNVVYKVSHISLCKGNSLNYSTH